MGKNSNHQMRPHEHLFPIVNAMIDDALRDMKVDRERISCKKGCDHCCHLLVEATWEEAVEIALWIKNLPKTKRKKILDRVLEHATQAKEFFKRKKSWSRFSKPVRGEKPIPDGAFDSYFYDEIRPCPFLEKKQCIAYEVRPTACRLHMVVSPAKLCARDVEDDSDYDTGERIEQLQEEAAPPIVALQRDGRWGQLSIMIESAYKTV